MNQQFELKQCSNLHISALNSSNFLAPPSLLVIPQLSTDSSDSEDYEFNDTPKQAMRNVIETPYQAQFRNRLAEC